MSASQAVVQALGWTTRIGWQKGWAWSVARVMLAWPPELGELEVSPVFLLELKAQLP